MRSSAKVLCVVSAVGGFLSAFPVEVAFGEDAPAGQRVFTPEGAPVDAGFFPVAVWLQDPRNAARYKAAGINLYVGLWQGPTQEQLDALVAAGLPVVCDQNAVALANPDNPLIAAWMQGDEPDNAQSLPDGKGYGPPIPPAAIQKNYAAMRKADPTRPVVLNLGQGVAWDGWHGRGTRTNHPEDYPEYVLGGDIISFDIYPAVHSSPEVAGRLELVPKGVERLVRWTKGEKPVWACIECSRIDNPKVKPTPDQVRGEVWMAIIRGARGIIYFTHQFKPEMREAAVLDDPELLPAITAINSQIRELSPVLNSPDQQGLSIQSDGQAVIGVLKHREGQTWVFAANLQNRPVKAVFGLETIAAGTASELGTSNALPVSQNSFSADFPPYGARLFRIDPPGKH